MPRFVAIYRDHVSDRSPVREEFTFDADSHDEAMATARKRASYRLQLVDVVAVQDDRGTDLSDQRDTTSRR